MRQYRLELRSRHLDARSAGVEPSMVIPGRAKGASPESITPDSGYGFRARPFGPSRNDDGEIGARRSRHALTSCRRGMARNPVAGDVDAATDPDAVVLEHVIEEPGQSLRAARAAD